MGKGIGGVSKGILRGTKNERNTCNLSLKASWEAWGPTSRLAILCRMPWSKRAIVIGDPQQAWKKMEKEEQKKRERQTSLPQRTWPSLKEGTSS
ncbi:hypothetical protein LIER_13174 [Lithospermum erythrorhizon]|uniref:Uncharacterized protein n=1 Tax=Lithospermum erythrorhizon TaxID=34254 RepID=A0AAV3PZ23_LITER